MSLEIDIAVDPAQAIAGAKKVTDELARTEAQSAKVKAAMTALGQSFAKVAEAIRADLSSSLGKAARAFDGLTEAIRREQEMLQRLHGPMKQAEQDLQTLESLHKRGAISAKQYGEELARIGKAAGLSRGNPMDAVSLPGGPQQADAPQSGAWKKYSKDAFRGMAMGMGAEMIGQNVRQGLTTVRDTLTEITSIPVGGQGTALGFMLGGPAGAAIGTLTEGFFRLGMNIGTLIVGTDEAAEAAKRYLAVMEGLRELNALEEQYEEQMRQTVKAQQDADASIGGMNRALAAHGDRFKSAKDEVIAYTFALDKLNEDLKGSTFTDRQQIELERSLRDAKVKLAGATSHFGDVSARVRLRTLHLNDAVSDLKGSFKAGEITAKEYREEMQRLTGATAKAAEWQLKLRELRKQENAQRNHAVAPNVSPGLGLTPGADPGFRGAIPVPFGAMADPWAGLAKPEIAQTFESIVGSVMKIPKAMAAATVEVVKFDAATQQLAANSIEALRGSVLSIGDAFVDAFTEAEFSWNKFFSGLTKDVAKMAIRNLLTYGMDSSGFSVAGMLGGGRVGFDAAVPGGRGAFLPGFRTGGDMLVGGSGGPDTKIAAFRVSPGETIHVRTPEQHKAAAQAARGGTRTITLEMPDGRRARFVTEDDFEELYLKATDRNAPAIRSRVTGR